MLRIIKENRSFGKKIRICVRLLRKLYRICWIQSALRVSGSYQPVSGWRELLKTKGGNRNAGETDQEKLAVVHTVFLWQLRENWT